MKNLFDILHDIKCMILYGLILDITLGMSRRDGFIVKIGTMAINSLVIDLYEYYIVAVGT